MTSLRGLEVQLVTLDFRVSVCLFRDYGSGPAGKFPALAINSGWAATSTPLGAQLLQ